MALFKIVVWAIIFLTKLRFPPGISIATVLKDRYKNNGSLAAFRKYQRIDLKLSKAKLDLSFLTKCKSHEVIPQFSNFKVTNQRLKSSAAYRQCQRKLLEEDIFNKQCRIRKLKIELSTVYGCLADLVSSLDLVHLKPCLNLKTLNSFNVMKIFKNGSYSASPFLRPTPVRLTLTK